MKIYSRKAGRKISGIADKALSELMCYEWPGNIRELENVIEGAVLLAKGNSIEQVALPVSKPKGMERRGQPGRG